MKRQDCDVSIGEEKKAAQKSILSCQTALFIVEETKQLKSLGRRYPHRFFLSLCSVKYPKAPVKGRKPMLKGTLGVHKCNNPQFVTSPAAGSILNLGKATVGSDQSLGPLASQTIFKEPVCKDGKTRSKKGF